MTRLAEARPIRRAFVVTPVAEELREAEAIMEANPHRQRQGSNILIVQNKNAPSCAAACAHQQGTITPHEKSPLMIY